MLKSCMDVSNIFWGMVIHIIPHNRYYIHQENIFTTKVSVSTCDAWKLFCHDSGSNLMVCLQVLLSPKRQVSTPDPHWWVSRKSTLHHFYVWRTNRQQLGTMEIFKRKMLQLSLIHYFLQNITFARHHNTPIHTTMHLQLCLKECEN